MAKKKKKPKSVDEVVRHIPINVGQQYPVDRIRAAGYVMHGGSKKPYILHDGNHIFRNGSDVLVAGLVNERRQFYEIRAKYPIYDALNNVIEQLQGRHKGTNVDWSKGT